MFKQIKNFLSGKSFAPKINYPVFYVLKDNWFLGLPVVSRLLKNLCYHSAVLRKQFCRLICNERIVEIPLVLQNITIPKSSILDVGCNESLLTLHMASLGHQVTALDLNGYEFCHPNIEVVKGDICKIDLAGKKYDYIIFLSVIEHVGLGVYGEQDFEGGDRAALLAASKFLKPGGKMILSMPYGQASQSRTQRVYDAVGIQRLFEGFRIEMERYFKGLGQRYWQEVLPKELALVSSCDFTQGMAFFVISGK